MRQADKNSRNEHRYPSEENTTSLQVGCLGCFFFSFVCLFLFLVCWWVLFGFFFYHAHTPLPERLSKTWTAFPWNFFIPEDTYASTDHSRNQSSRPTLGFCTLQNTVLQCWIIFHRYISMNCSFSFFQNNLLHYSTICSICHWYKNTFSQFGPEISLICSNSDQNYTSCWQVPQWALDMTTLDFICDSCHQRLWCLNRYNFSWSYFTLWVMHLSLSLADLYISPKHS